MVITPCPLLLKKTAE